VTINKVIAGALYTVKLNKTALSSVRFETVKEGIAHFEY